MLECVQAFNLVEVVESQGIEHLGSKGKNWMSNRRALKQYERERERERERELDH